LLPVDVDADGATLTGGTPRAGEPLDPAPLLAAVGLDASHLGTVAPRTTGVGIDWTFLPVTREALVAVRPDPAALAALPSTGLSLVVLGEPVRSRVFPGGVGVPEDPATGSAALALGVFLAASGLVDTGTSAYVVEQGLEMGRPSTLSCTVQVEGGAAVRTTVRGSVVPVARGEVRVPPA
ncbi:MAG: PhzF family phenazine biosynthesis protein, partial [Mycobacteriales bacterium]